MVATVDELFQVIRSNPFIDGIGYFVEVTVNQPVTDRDVDMLTERMQADFCPHSRASSEGENVLGLDFHEHIMTQGDEAAHFLAALEALMRSIERNYGVEHLCIEFQFDFQKALAARTELDELLKP